MRFNDEKFITEVKEYIEELNVSSVFEVGCMTGELLRSLDKNIKTGGIDLDPKVEGVIQGDIFDFRPREKWDLVFSSGLLEHYPVDEAIEIIKIMARISKKYVLNYVPNTECIAYKNAKAKTKASWKYELDYTKEDLRYLHEQAGLRVLGVGHAGANWAKRFGPEPSEPYLVYCLAKKPNLSRKRVSNHDNEVVKGR